MSYKDLQSFIQALRENNELIDIYEEVSTELEIAAIADRISKGPAEYNKALLFHKVKDHNIPVLINALGSYERLNIAFGVKSLDEIAARIKGFLNLKVEDNLLGKIGKLIHLSEIAKFPPKIITNPAPCQEVIITDIHEPMLDKLPILKCWQYDGGPYITMPLVFTKDPETGIRNIGMYRLQKYNNSSTGFHVHWHHGAAEHFRKAKNQDITNHDPAIIEPEWHGTKITEKPRFDTLRKIPVAVVIGADPAMVYSATAPLPPMIDETIFAGFLRRSPIELVKCKTIDLEVPAHAEIILEGYVDLDQLAWEGPFGDHTGFYSLAGDFPVFQLTAITHRKNPVYMTTVVGRPPQEDCYLGKATERIFLPLLQLIMPDIVDLNLPLAGVFHNCAIVKIQKKYPGHARQIMNAIWGNGQMAFTKYIIVCDHDIDIHNLEEVAWIVFGNTDPERDMLFTKGPLDILDHAATYMGYGSKVGIDATRKWSSEGFTRDWPREMKVSEDMQELLESRWGHLFGQSIIINQSSSE